MQIRVLNKAKWCYRQSFLFLSVTNEITIDLLLQVTEERHYHKADKICFKFESKEMQFYFILLHFNLELLCKM